MSASAITYLPFASSRKSKQSAGDGASQSHPQALAPSSSTPQTNFVAAKLARLRVQRVDRFFRKRAEQREVMAEQKQNLSALVTHKLSKLLSLFSRSSRPALQAKLRAFFSHETIKRGVRGFLGAIRNCVKRLRGPSPAELLHRELLRQQKAARRQAFLQLLFRALAVQGRNLLRTKRKHLRRELVNALAHAVAVALVQQTLLGENQLARLAQQECARRDAAKQRSVVIVIQRAWRRLRRAHLTRLEAKTQLLDLLATITPELRRNDELIQQHRSALQRACEQTHAQIMDGARRRLAARLVQRVWRGYRARLRVFQLCAWRRKKAQQQLQRERLQKARHALLQPSEREQQQQRTIDLRVRSRMQRTPLMLSPGATHRLRHQELTHPRTSLLEPLPMTNPPPRISALTRAKTQCVPFTKFEKICAQRARVNPQNLWVAIPVGFDDADAAAAARGRRGGKQRVNKRNRFLAAQYDWVPATLLQSPQEQQ